METRSILVMNWRDIRNPEAGGAEVYTHEVAKRWVEWGHSVTILTSRFKDSLPREDIDGVTIARTGTRLTVYRHARKLYLKEFRKDTDVVVDEVNTRPFLTPRYVRGGARVTALIHQLAREFWFYETPFPVSVLGRYWLEDHWLRGYRAIPTVALSDSTRNDLVRLGFKDVTVVHPGTSTCPLPTIPEKEADPTLLFLGRLKAAKLPDHALKAFALIKKRLPKAKLWMAGEGYLRKSLERDAPHGTVFLGLVPDREKARLLQRAHLLLYPAVREGWGLTILEACSVGTPAIGYDVPGLHDSVRNGETGFLVPFGDVSMLAQKALLLLQDPRLRQRISENALRWSRDFDWTKTARSVLKVVTRSESN